MFGCYTKKAVCKLTLARLHSHPGPLVPQQAWLAYMPSLCAVHVQNKHVVDR